MVSGSGSGRSETSGCRMFGSKLTIFNRSRRNKTPLYILKHSDHPSEGMRAEEGFREFFISCGSVLMA